MSEPAEEGPAPRALLLAGDVGASKTNLGLFRPGAGGPRLVRGGHYASADFPGLAALIAEFLGGGGEPVGAACFGVPGPVAGNSAQTTNLAWDVDGEKVAAAAGIPRLGLVNDLVATAEGIPLLGSDDFVLLHAGDPKAAGNRALIAAGTGLGMALLPLAGGVHLPVASEGGHMDFAPRDDDEVALFQTLRRRFGGHVSVERVVSGGGLRNVYEHLRDAGLAPPSPDVERALGEEDADPARTISEAGLAGRCGICVRALAMFVAAYGAAAGNLALVGTATGGVYLGGGIAPKIVPALAEGTFLRAFFDKGRFRAYMEAIPVRVIRNERTAMFGAARLANRLLSA